VRECDFETILAKYPDMIDKGLRLLGHQVTMFGRRMDLLFEDRFNRKLIIELKVGPIKDEHIGQVLSYEGMLLSADDPTVRVMLIGNRVPPNIQRALDHHGIAWREITFSLLRDYLREEGDIELLSLVGEEAAVNHKGIPKIKTVSSITVKSLTAPDERVAALLAPVEPTWIEQAFQFLVDKEKLYFYTNAAIGGISTLRPLHVYFKPKGTTHISTRADWVELTTNNLTGFRLPGAEKSTGKWFYGFRNIMHLEMPIDLSALSYFASGNNLRHDLPGACIIIDPIH
jgi:hypothetical protein